MDMKIAEELIMDEDVERTIYKRKKPV